MSITSQTGVSCDKNIAGESSFAKFLRSLVTFFSRRSITRAPRIYHGDYSYYPMPDTAFFNFLHMKQVTFVETGDCYVYIFDKPQYQGNYNIAGPKEVVPICNCGSMIISLKKLPIDMIQKDGKPPKEIWEASGASYQYHCSTGYKYV